MCMLQAVTSGDGFKYNDSLGKEKDLHPTPEMQQLALTLLDDVAAGTVNPKRAWAGLLGEGSRRGAAGSEMKSPTDWPLQTEQPRRCLLFPLR